MPIFRKIKGKISEFRHESDFYDAIIGKRINKLEPLCKKHNGYYINYYHNGSTPIHISIIYGFNEGTIELLKNKANPDLPCIAFSNKTALELALDNYAININVSLIRLLGFYGAKPPVDDTKFKTKEIKEAYEQGRNVFLGKKSIEGLAALENDSLFKNHYIEIMNPKIPIHVSSEIEQTERSSLLNYYMR